MQLVALYVSSLYMEKTKKPVYLDQQQQIASVNDHQMHEIQPALLQPSMFLFNRVINECELRHDYDSKDKNSLETNDIDYR